MDNPIPHDMPRPVGVANFRIITGHDFLLKHLHRFGLADSPACPLCSSNFDMSGEHLYGCPGLADVVATNAAKDFGHFLYVSELYWAARNRLLAAMSRSGVG